MGPKKKKKKLYKARLYLYLYRVFIQKKNQLVTHFSFTPSLFPCLHDAVDAKRTLPLNLLLFLTTMTFRLLSLMTCALFNISCLHDYLSSICSPDNEELADNEEKSHQNSNRTNNRNKVSGKRGVSGKKRAPVVESDEDEV
jgi:hypothetical protein